MDVILASHAHHVPQVGLPHIDPVTKDIKQNINPIGAKDLYIINAFLILKRKFKIVKNPIREKHAKQSRMMGRARTLFLLSYPG